jgi:hypothetical protein
MAPSDKGDVLARMEQMVERGQIRWSGRPAPTTEATAMGDANEYHGIIKSLRVASFSVLNNRRTGTHKLKQP